MSVDAVGDVRIAYEVRGDGRAARARPRARLRPRTAGGRCPTCSREDFRVVLIDNRGVGESDVPAGPYAVSQMAEDVARGARRRGDRARRTCSASRLGGYIAQELALAAPRARPQARARARRRPGGPRSHPMPAAGIEAFAPLPDDGARGRPAPDGRELARRARRARAARARRGDLSPTGSSARRRSRAGRRRRTRARPSTRTTASARSTRRHSCSRAAPTPSSTRGTPSCSAS